MFLFTLTLHALLRSTPTLPVYSVSSLYMIYIRITDNDMVHSIGEIKQLKLITVTPYRIIRCGHQLITYPSWIYHLHKYIY